MIIKKVAVFSLFSFICGASAVFGQVNNSQVVNNEPNLSAQVVTRGAVVRNNNLYCAGFISSQPVNESLEVVGGEEEQEQNVYTQSNFIYFSGGAQAGVKVGDRYAVTRPRGSFRSKFSAKGKLGIYTQEVATVVVTKVKQTVAVGQVEYSCETVLLGDILAPYTTRVAPERREEPTFDRFLDPNGKSVGRVVLARDGQEMLTRDQIVYLDLGAEDSVKNGDYLTIFRPLGKGNITGRTQREIVRPEDPGFESDEFRGGKFSNQAPRRKGSNADREIVTTPNAKTRRPDGLRKVVGELVIINVQQRSATAVITRTAQEIHTGDYVEVQ